MKIKSVIYVPILCLLLFSCDNSTDPKNNADKPEIFFHQMTGFENGEYIYTESNSCVAGSAISIGLRYGKISEYNYVSIRITKNWEEVWSNNFIIKVSGSNATEVISNLLFNANTTGIFQVIAELYGADTLLTETELNLAQGEPFSEGDVRIIFKEVASTGGDENHEKITDSVSLDSKVYVTVLLEKDDETESANGTLSYNGSAVWTEDFKITDSMRKELRFEFNNPITPVMVGSFEFAVTLRGKKVKVLEKELKVY